MFYKKKKIFCLENMVKAILIIETLRFAMDEMHSIQNLKKKAMHKMKSMKYRKGESDA